MTNEQWNVIEIIIGIISLLGVGSGFKFLSAGLKNLNKFNDQDKRGKLEVGLGISLTVIAVISIAVAIPLVKNNIIFKPTNGESGSNSSTEAEASVITDFSSEGTGRPYVEDQPYQGAVYTGYVNELRQPNGEGTMTYSDGRKYTGDWVDGIQQGYGKMIYHNGVYEGEWQNGKRNGKGTYTWSDGKKYEGTYVDDVRSGKGIFSGWVDLTNGYSGTYYGESKNDHFDGYGHFIFDNGDEFEGIYKEDVYWTGTYTRKDGSRYEVVNGKPQY